jgi:Fur family peroxide stress response transcriptional regulator
MDAFTRTCRTKGLKATHQRMEIFREVAGSDAHPDAEAIYRKVSRRIPAISRDTVYRTLSTLEEYGLIRKAEVMSGPVRFDANTDRHHHFVCTSCGAIRDFRSNELDHLPIPRSVRSMGRVECAQVQVRGICTACARRKRARR